MKLSEFRAITELGFATDLVHQDKTTGNVYVMCDDQSVLYIIKVLRYFLNDKREWEVEVLFNDEDYVCACSVFGDCLNSEYVDPLKGLKFTCPKCEGHRMECCQDGHHISEVMLIDEDGDHEYGELQSEGYVTRWQCLTCGYGLEFSGDADDTDNVDMAKWVKGNCE